MDQDRYYAEHYSEILNSGGLGLVSRYIHSRLEKNIDIDAEVVLELGAGLGQHLSFVKHKFARYYETDIRDENLPNRKQRENFNGKVIKMKLDAQDLSFIQNGSISRIVSNCLLIHLDDPEKALKEWKRCLRIGEGRTGG